jgi:hypothetical protein
VERVLGNGGREGGGRRSKVSMTWRGMTMKVWAVDGCRGKGGWMGGRLRENRLGEEKAEGMKPLIREGLVEEC